MNSSHWDVGRLVEIDRFEAANILTYEEAARMRVLVMNAAPTNQPLGIAVVADPSMPKDRFALVSNAIKRHELSGIQKEITKAADKIAIAHMKMSFVVGGRVRYSTDEGMSWREDVVVELFPEGPKLAHAGQWILCEPGLIEMIPEPCNCQGDERCPVCFPLVVVNVGEFKTYKCDPPPLIARSCEKCVNSTGELLASFRAQLDAERQRANRLGDSLGIYKKHCDERLEQITQLRTMVADLESDLRVARNTIKKRDEQISMLKRYPR